MRSNITLMLFLLSLSSMSFASDMLPAEKVINGLEQAINAAKKQNDAPVLFPKEVPISDKKYYASLDATATKNGFAYWINIDSTPDCNGVHVCNIGSIRAEVKGSPSIEYDMQNNEITVPVTLAYHRNAYFTPGHPMGSYFPPQIEWRNKNVLYTLIWTDIPKSQSEKSILVQMANSAEK